MSNKTRLQTNNTNLQSLIDKANSLPDISSGGSASIETCTVNITSDNNAIANYMFVTFENDQIGCVYKMTVGSSTSTPMTVSNVVCGSIAYIMGTYSFTGFTMNNCEKIARISTSSAMIKFTADANGTATIHMFNND